MTLIIKETPLTNIRTPTSIETMNGHYIDLANPSPAMIRLEDIAQGLATEGRYGGFLAKDGEFIDGIFSVAQHAVYASYLVGDDPEAELTALHHDDSEGVMHDMPTPAKRQLPDFQRMEDSVQVACYTRFGCVTTPEIMALVHKADHQCLMMEAVYFEKEWADYSFTPLFDHFVGHHVMGVKEAREFYISRHNEIMAKLGR